MARSVAVCRDVSRYGTVWRAGARPVVQPLGAAVCFARGMEAGTAMTARITAIPIDLAGMVHDSPT